MNTLVDDFDNIGQLRKEREIHLSTSTVLGIFFGLALICALFFGFGYTAGRRSAIGTTETAEAGSPGFTNFKPAPGAVAIQPVAGYMTAKQAADANANANNAQHFYGGSSASNNSSEPTAASTVVNYSMGGVQTHVSQAQPVTAVATPKPAQLPKVSQQPIEAAPVAVRQVVAAVATPQAPALQPVNVQVSPGAPPVVQIAAVSHQEDADVLLSALKRHGYAVFTASAATDRLIHVQLGPFANRKDADAMRQRLLSDGYNAIVK